VLLGSVGQVLHLAGGVGLGLAFESLLLDRLATGLLRHVLSGGLVTHGVRSLIGNLNGSVRRTLRRSGTREDAPGPVAITTVPGFLLADFYDSAIGRQFGADVALGVEESMSGMWALTAMAA
jgi:hypothetical protein